MFNFPWYFWLEHLLFTKYLLAIGLVILATYLIVRRKKVKTVLPWVLIGVALGLASWNYSIIYRDQHRFTAEDIQLAKKLTFKTFNVSYLPGGVSKKSIGVATTGQSPYLFFDLTGAIGSIYEFDINKIDSGKSGQCGPEVPEGGDIDLYIKGDYQRNCTFVQTTRNGFNVHTGEYGLSPNSSYVDKHYYATNGTTRVTLDSGLPANIVVKVFEGLKPVNPQDLHYINKDN